MSDNVDGAEDPLTYAGAGVDIGAGERAVELIKDHVRSTLRPEVVGDIGGFGGLFAYQPRGMRDPILVSSTDGVGTKSLIARLMGKYDTIGIDLVAGSVDDIAVQGAEPLFFLDYISTGKLVEEIVADIVSGVAHGCRTAGCALLGGEMSEHDIMEPGEFDLVGFAVGVVERDQLLGGDAVRPGDIVLGIPSPGLRSNGYSLARRVLFDVAGRGLDEPAYEGARHTLADELLEPSVIYSPAMQALLRQVDVHAAAHITGGGLASNLARVLPRSVDATITRRSWEEPRIFGEIKRLGDIADEEMGRVFNLGIGMVVVVASDDAHRALDILRTNGHRAVEIGEISRGEGRVELT
jgi:phosphoribosylformylglycinamidine cyclo-ligase